jgi:acyl carrier protein
LELPEGLQRSITQRSQDQFLRRGEVWVMTENEIFHELEAIFRDVFLTDSLQLSFKTTAQDVPGWDSFKMIEIILAIENRFGTKMETRDIDRMKNVGDIVMRISDKMPKSAPQL